jgi:putative transposase
VPTANVSTALTAGPVVAGLDADARGWREGVLGEVTRLVIEAVLEAELTEHLRGVQMPPLSRRAGGNCRNGTRRKTVWTIAGPVAIDAPRDRWGTFQPVTVGKWQRRVVGVDQLVLPLAAAGSSLDDTYALLAQGYGTAVDRRVLLLMAASVRARLDPWHQRPRTDPCHALLLGRALVRSRTFGHLAPPVHTAVAVGVDGSRELLGLWLRPADGGLDGWWRYLRGMRGRGLRSPQTVVTQALPGAVDEVASIWPGTAVYLRAAEPTESTRLSARRVR